MHGIVMRNRDVIDAEVKHERDFTFDYFGFKVGGTDKNLSEGICRPLYVVAHLKPSFRTVERPTNV